MVDTKNEIWKEIRLNTNYLVSNLGMVNLSMLAALKIQLEHIT